MAPRAVDAGVSRVETADGLELHVEAHGEGIPVLFSCAFSTTHENWRPQVEPLVRAGVRVVLWDYRGHGRSDAPHDISAGQTTSGGARASGKGVLADVEQGEVFGRVVQHPGQAPRPWLRPALEENADRAIEVMGAAVGPAIEAEARKQARRNIRRRRLT